MDYDCTNRVSNSSSSIDEGPYNMVLTIKLKGGEQRNEWSD